MNTLIGTMLGSMLFLGAVGCGRDPILERADELGEQAHAGGGVPGGGGPGAGSPPAPPPGDPAEPPPGKGEDPPAGRAADPPPGTPDEPAPGAPGADGPSVTVSGEVRLADYELGKVRIDIFDGDQKDLEGPRPSVVAVAEIERPGPFSVQVPVSAPQVWIGAYVDEDLNGRPGPLDPAGWYAGNPVETEGGADGVIIELQRQEPPPQRGL